MRKNKAELIMSISALITAVVAVWIAVVEQQSNREYQRLSVEPYLELSNSNANIYERLLFNTGLGPARIKTVDVSVNGKAVSNWVEIQRALASDYDENYSYGGLWKGRQIKAGEQIVLLHLTEKEMARKFHHNVSKITMKICYCSIYKECWVKEDSKIPWLVPQCPVNSHESFPR